MAEMKNGRKKHVVEGTVSEIKRSERVVEKKVGGPERALKAFRNFWKGVTGK